MNIKQGKGKCKRERIIRHFIISDDARDPSSYHYSLVL
jgi:hypothetical protein